MSNTNINTNMTINGRIQLNRGLSTNTSKAKDVVLLGLLTALVFVAQVALAFVPNVELVSLLFILYTILLGKRVFLIIYAFVMLEGLFYGFGLWWLNYTYTWSTLALIALCFRKQTSVWFWSIFSGFYGLAYGALCSIIYLFIGGIPSAFAYWISGIPFDITHCIGNFIVCLILYKPLRSIMEQCLSAKI